MSLLQVQYFIPSIDPVIDVVATIGFGVGLIVAIYLQGVKHYPAKTWIPFLAIAVSFGFLGAEGGALDFLAPGMFRLIAMILLIIAEIVGGYSAVRPAIFEYKK